VVGHVWYTEQQTGWGTVPTVSASVLHRSSRRSVVIFRAARNMVKLECGPVPNVMAALSDTGGASSVQRRSLVDAHY